MSVERWAQAIREHRRTRQGQADALVDGVAEVICNTGFAPDTANIVEPEPPFDALMGAVAAGNVEAIEDLRELRMKARAVIDHLGAASRAIREDGDPS